MACIPHILSPLSHSTTLANLINITNFEIHNRTSIIISPNSRPKKKKKKIFAIGNRVGVDTETAVIEIEKRQLQLSKGHPSPYGATPQEDGVNFAINSLNSLSATLCFFTLSDFKNVYSNSIQFQISQLFRVFRFLIFFFFAE